MSAPLVIKVGGSTLDRREAGNEGSAAVLRRRAAAVRRRGGRAAATRRLAPAGLPGLVARGPQGRDEQALPVVAAVFAGLVNKRLVAALADAGLRAVGLSGVDGGLLPCRLADPALGFVGEPQEPNPALLQALVAAGFVPVGAPIGFPRVA